jgi:hypothetical protein
MAGRNLALTACELLASRPSPHAGLAVQRGDPVAIGRSILARPLEFSYQDELASDYGCIPTSNLPWAQAPLFIQDKCCSIDFVHSLVRY